MNPSPQAVPHPLPPRAQTWLPVLALLFFLAASILFIDRQGIHEDDGRRGLHTLEFLSQLAHPAARPWRLMEVFYVGTLNSFLLMPSIGLLGPTAVALRLPYILLALAAMGLMFLVLRRLFQTPTALLTVCLLAVNSTWIRSARLGGYREEILQIFFLWLILALLTVPRRPRWATAAFAAGLALWAKIMFLGYLAGLAAAVMIFGPPGKDTGAPPGRGNWRTVPAAGLAFLAGLSPLLYWNHSNGWATFRMLFRSLVRAQGNEALCNNTHLTGNLLERLSHLVQLLTSQITFIDLDGVANTGCNAAYLLLALVSATGTGAFLLSRAASRADRARLGFLAVLYATLFLCSCYAPVGRYSGHLIMLFPLPELLAAFFFCRVLAPPAAPPWLRPMVAAMLVAHAGTEALVTTRALDGIRRGRVADYMATPAMFPVARVLIEARAASLVTFCSAVGLNVGYLCGDRVEVHGALDARPSDNPALVPGLLQLPPPVFLLVLDGERAQEDMNAWLDVWRNAGMVPELFKSFPQTGYVFRLYRITRPASSGALRAVLAPIKLRNPSALRA